MAEWEKARTKCADLCYELNMSTADITDLDELMKLYKAAVGEEGCTWNEDYPNEDDIRGDIGRASLYCMRDGQGSIMAAFAIDDDAEVRALSCWSAQNEPAGEVSRLVVRRDCQNRGIARRMLAFAMEELARRGYAGIHFLVSKTNERAIRSYSRLNFELAGETELYGQDWYCYEKELHN